jgi:hypothetical protein
MPLLVMSRKNLLRNYRMTDLPKYRKPLGTVTEMPGITTEIWTMAVFDAKEVPIGTELFAQPSENRLNLELQVAKDHNLLAQNSLRQAEKEARMAKTMLADAVKYLAKIEAEGTVQIRTLIEIRGFLYTIGEIEDADRTDT